MYNQKLRAVSLAILLSLTLSLIFPVGVLADDNPPPSPEMPEVVTPEEDGVVDETAPESQDGGSTLAEETGATVSPESETLPVDESADVDSATTETPLLGQLPEGTEVIVLNDEGQVVPLVSQEAQAVIAGSDPMWCPDGVDPIAGVGGCTNGYSSMTALLSALSGANQPAQNGTIWIERTYNSSTAEPGATTIININGGTYTTWRNYSLTVQGGWDGPGTNTYSGASIFSGDRLWIDNWLNNITVRNILVSNANGDQGLRIDNDGAIARNVTVENVTVTSTTSANGYGLYIDTNEHNGTVTVRNSTFTNNGNDGLYIEAMGGVTLQNITSTGNVNEGAQIINTDSTTRSPVQVLGTNTFSGNTGYGLQITTDGAVALNNITADNNTTQDGVSINNDQGNADATSTVTLTGSNYFRNNGNDVNDDGLIIVSRGAVSLTNVTATGNRDEGVEIDNTPSSTRASVTIGGTNLFNGNTGNGLVVSSDGVINLNNITANDSINDNGAVLNNNQSGANSSSGITITGNNSFSGNDEYGLEIDSMGAVALQNIAANNNERQYGVNINNDVTGASAAVSSVTITGTNSFSGNDDYGLEIDSRGAVSLANVTADGNKTQYGVNIDNVSNAVGNVSSVTISGNNSFSGNYDYGLEIDSIGAVSLENITASDNKNGDGANIDNGGGTGAVTLTGLLTFRNNGNNDGDDGLYIRTQGSLTLANIIASLNKDEGVEIDTTPGTGSVTITGGTYNQNIDNGLYVRSRGLITLVDVTANQNGNNGGDVSNNVANSIAGANVFVVRSTFNSNGDDGLYAGSNLDVVLINVTALNNDNDGVELYSNGDNVVLCGGVFSGNDAGGGSTDYNVRLNNGSNTRTRSSDIVVTNWTPTTGWTTVTNGTGRCNFLDTDTDLLPNTWDADDDNDGILDGADACPVGAAVGTDTDGDGCKDTTEDTDNDNDGVLNASDSCPVGARVGTDTDGDGCKDTTEDTDNDNDGVLNTGDACPVGAAVGTDTDGDGCKDTTEDTDNDNDGVLNAGDACPVGATVGTDTDGDGCKDTTEDSDNDNDGVLNASDACPIGAAVGTDTDGDGCKNTEDADDDNDGVLDVNDAFPLNPGESADTDGDGTGNNADTDDDNDGVPDVNDAFPLNPGESVDTDGDGIGDNADTDDDNDGLSDATEIFLAKVEERHPNSVMETGSFIPVTGAAALSCTELLTSLEMAGFEVVFDSLCGYSAGLGEISENELPGALPSGGKFVSGISIILLQNGSPVGAMPADTSITLSFDIPSSMAGKTLTVLHWDSTAGGWAESDASVVDGKVILTDAAPGIFVLVSGK